MTYTYGATAQTCNRLMPHAVTSTSDGKTYSFDCNGNLTADGDRTLTWNADNRPLSISKTDVGTTTFAYSGGGARVKKVGPSKTIRYVKWDQAPVFRFPTDCRERGCRIFSYGRRWPSRWCRGPPLPAAERPRAGPPGPHLRRAARPAGSVVLSTLSRPNVRAEAAFDRLVVEAIGQHPPCRIGPVLPDPSARPHVLPTDRVAKGERNLRQFLVRLLHDLLPFGFCEPPSPTTRPPTGSQAAKWLTRSWLANKSSPRLVALRLPRSASRAGGGGPPAWSRDSGLAPFAPIRNSARKCA